VSAADAKEFSRFQLIEKDILFVMVGATLGKVGRVGSHALPALLNQNMWRIRARGDLANQDFLYYSFKENVAEIIGWASGSARGFLRRDDCRNLQIRIPHTREQKAIAHILGTIDDKIELNRKTNETLEAMAKALFKSWFVDFDLVRAKAEGRPTGLPAEISDLFPDSFEDSELGEIPSVWEVKALDKIAHFLNGLALQKFPPEDGSATLPVIKIAQLKKGDSTGADRCSTAVPSDYVVRDGDMLFSWSGSLAASLRVV